MFKVLCEKLFADVSTITHYIRLMKFNVSTNKKARGGFSSWRVHAQDSATCLKDSMTKTWHSLLSWLAQSKLFERFLAQVQTKRSSIFLLLSGQQGTLKKHLLCTLFRKSKRWLAMSREVIQAVKFKARAHIEDC